MTVLRIFSLSLYLDYDRASPLLTPETPRGISRTKRLSAIRKAIDDAVPQDSEDREERLKVSFTLLLPFLVYWLLKKTST